MIKIVLENKELIAKMQLISAALLPKVTGRALDRAATSARHLAGQLVAADTGLALGVAKAAIKIRRSATAVEITAPYKRIPLIEFKAKGPEPSRGKGSGVSYKLPTGRGRLPHAFIATMPESGHRGVFERIPGKFMKGKPTRQAIGEKFGPSMGRSFEKALPQVQVKAQEALVTNLRHEIDRATGGK